eukprot:5776677-Amphidinium_carterae.1
MASSAWTKWLLAVVQASFSALNMYAFVAPWYAVSNICPPKRVNAVAFPCPLQQLRQRGAPKQTPWTMVASSAYLPMAEMQLMSTLTLVLHL